MKKSKLLALGLIALLLVGGLVLAACDEKDEKSCHGEGECISSGKATLLYGKQYKSCGYSACKVYGKIADDYDVFLCDCS